MARLGPDTEYAVQRQVCEYLRFQYPKVIFNSDGAGTYTTRAVAGMQMALRSRRGYPDLFVAEARGVYHGLFLELKRPGTRVVLANGNLSTNLHIQEQASVLNDLSLKGYWCAFAVGFEDAKNQIDHYMSR